MLISDKNDKNYQIFKQLIQTFYNAETEENINEHRNIQHYKSIKIEPKIIYDSYQKNLKIQFKIGDKQLYKIKDLTEFFDRMLEGEKYQYGTKLEFLHDEIVFEDTSIPILHYLLKYAEILKYANESKYNYNYHKSVLELDSIIISNTGLDELFDIINDKYIIFQNEYGEQKIFCTETEPDIKFNIEPLTDGDYKVSSNVDMHEIQTFEGKEYLYVLYKNKLHRCKREFQNTVLKLLKVFKDNYIKDIVIKEKDLPQLFSIVFPKVKNNININRMEKDKKDKYIPKDLYVKLFLDFDENNYIIADIRFVYGDKEFNPLLQEKIDIARDIFKENEVLNMFLKTGFMLDTKNARLILVSDENIYNFLQQDIEIYMQKFEVLATENFKRKEIREAKIGNIGVKIENNLLHIDFSNMDFSIDELNEILKKYNLKKKYHRLKDGSFLKLEENSTMQFISSITNEIGINYKQLEKGELKLPLNRSMYLDRILQKMNNTFINKSVEYKELVNVIDNKDISEEIKITDNLNVNLRNYQMIGFKWLIMLDRYGLGGILADDMGLGKTVQILAVILKYIEENKNPKPSIVVCPSSLALNWQAEVEKFTPTIKSMVIKGSMQERHKQIKSISDYQLIITSYDLLKRDIDIYQELNYEFKYIIADEAQYIKNNNTQNAKTIKLINAETKYALTGTPIENSLAELWSIFDFIMPGYLFNYKRFKELYEIPIAKDENGETIKKLKMLIEPFVLRRVKKEVLTELPDKTITVLNNEMQDEQEKIYASYIVNAKKEAINEINQKGFEKSQMKILALLMRLRQICCHPSLFLSNYNGESSKLNQCMEVVKDAVQAGHKILLFSSYTGMFDILEKELNKENITYFKLTGKTKVGDRIKLVDEFNENENVKVFLISLKAGGTGLNLIGADVVIHYDPWWNLSTENQATDRTYRIGQKRNVQVYKMITKNSIEEKIYEIQKRKENLANNMLSTDQTFISKLSKDDIMQLFE